MTSRKLSTSLFKALDLLTLIASSERRLSIHEIVESMSLPRSSLLRLLDSLIHYGLVARDSERRYFVTSKFREWRIDDVCEREVARFRPLMRRIAAEVGEMAIIGRLEGRHVRYLHFEEPSSRVRVTPPVGKQYPLQNMAMGKLAMSQRPDLIPEDCSARLKEEIKDAERLHVAWNRRESESDIITWGTWLGEPSPLTSLLVVAWPDFRYSEDALQKVLAILKEESPKTGPFALFETKRR